MVYFFLRTKKLKIIQNITILMYKHMELNSLNSGIQILKQWHNARTKNCPLDHMLYAT